MDNESTLISTIKNQAFTEPLQEFKPREVVQEKVQVVHRESLLGDKDLQYDILVLMCIYILLHSDSVQNVMTSKIPSLYVSGKPTLMGLAVQAVILIGIWKVSKSLYKGKPIF